MTAPLDNETLLRGRVKGEGGGRSRKKVIVGWRGEEEKQRLWVCCMSVSKEGVLYVCIHPYMQGYMLICVHITCVCILLSIIHVCPSNMYVHITCMFMYAHDTYMSIIHYCPGTLTLRQCSILPRGSHTHTHTHTHVIRTRESAFQRTKTLSLSHTHTDTHTHSLSLSFTFFRFLSLCVIHSVTLSHTLLGRDNTHTNYLGGREGDRRKDVTIGTCHYQLYQL